MEEQGYSSQGLTYEPPNEDPQLQVNNNQGYIQQEYQGNTYQPQIENVPQYPSPEMAGQPNLAQKEFPEKELPDAGADAEADIEQEIKENMRAGFVRKVYGLLTAQLIVTAGFIALTFIKSVKEWIRESFHFRLIEIFCAIGMILFCVATTCIYCNKQMKRLELLFLGGFTICMSGLLMGLTAHFDNNVVIIAVALTAAVTIGLTVYSCKMTENFAFLGAFAFSFIFLFFFSFAFMLLGIFIPRIIVWWYVTICFMGVMIFSIYLIIDTQLILGKLGVGFGIDDYVLAAMNLYLDIIYLFVYILRILGASQR